MRISKIAIIGNGGGGKTTRARKLAELHGLPLTHVDSIQFIKGMRVRPVEETTAILSKIATEPEWIIDGFGTLEVIEKRFELADRVLMVDLPLWRHYFWATKRQVKAIWKTRSELPTGCEEGTIGRTIELYKILWRVHRKIRPRLLEILSRPELSEKVIHVRTPGDLKRAELSLHQ